MSVGAALVAFGVIKEDFNTLPAIGALMSIISLSWVLFAKSGKSQILLSLIRKSFSAVGGALVAYGIANPEQNQAIAGALLPVLSLVLSGVSNGDGRNLSNMPVLLGALVAFSFVSLPSCSIGLDPVTGLPVFRPDTETILILSDKAASHFNDGLSDRIIISAEK
jgi:hypothetical protein